MFVAQAATCFTQQPPIMFIVLAATCFTRQLVMTFVAEAATVLAQQLSKTFVALAATCVTQKLLKTLVAQAATCFTQQPRRTSSNMCHTTASENIRRTSCDVTRGKKSVTVGSKVNFSNKPLGWRQVVGNQLCGQANPRTVSAKQSASNKPVVEGCFNSLVSPERVRNFKGLRFSKT